MMLRTLIFKVEPNPNRMPQIRFGLVGKVLVGMQPEEFKTNLKNILLNNKDFI